MEIPFSLPGTQPQTAANFGLFYVNRGPGPLALISASERHETAGSDGSAVTMQIVKVPSGVAKGSGVSLLANPFNLKGTANTNQVGDIVSSGVAVLQVGDGLALALTGTPTAVVGISGILTLNPLF